MRKALVLVNNKKAGILEELTHHAYRFNYFSDYHGAPVSLTMTISQLTYESDHFPSFFEGLLPEGTMLEAMLRQCKLDKNDYFGQLLQIGKDVVGAVTVEEIK